MNKFKTYYTIDNGAKKYKIVVSDKEININTNTNINTELIYRIKNYKKVFIGKNYVKYGLYDGLFIGSSILVELKNKEYMFIGHKIFKFKTTESIIKYYSIMGNSSVVYPFALTENYAYLMLDNVYLKRDFGNNDPYKVYYNLDKKSYKYSIKRFK